MALNFSEATNQFIDKLVEISWGKSKPHNNEILLTRSISEAEIVTQINDEDDNPDLYEGPIPINLSKTSSIRGFDVQDFKSHHKIIIAVDTGLTHLGEFVGGGIAFAIRGAAHCIIDNDVTILRYNTGPIFVDSNNMLPIFHYLGERLGNETLYVKKIDENKFALRDTVLQDTNQVQDRCRNFVERMIQEEAVGIMKTNYHGLLLIDGALSGGTFDTPSKYMKDMLETTSQNKIDVAAISKKTKIRVAGKPLSSLFDEEPAFVGFMPLKEIIRSERISLVEQGLARDVDDITLGNELYAARFGLGPPALTFRVDVKNSKRSTQEDVINSVFSDCQIHGCYPKPLIEVHQQSSFLYQDVQLLLADLVVRTGARPKERQSMDWLFAPIGSFGK
ncbi:MAG: hypothetical protein JW963_25145 [Anaerolineales bacterium]|nr:hypothetical protein [Anaerolineales bacterium]